MDKIRENIHQHLWNDYDPNAEFPGQTPLLAHYTSIENFDLILESEELWLANPLNMNDSEELTFGMNQGALETQRSESLFKACKNKHSYDRLLSFFDAHFNSFYKNYALDTYISCFSLHDEKDMDGSLSMWRGYGANGNGVAFIIDTKKLESQAASPIALSSINYATTEERVKWIKEKLNLLAKLIETHGTSDDVLDNAAWNWVERLRVFSLLTKHKGFEDEKEWRFVYFKDRDKEESYFSMFGYNISGKGVEPKLKLNFEKIDSASSSLRLENIISRIILGPTASSTLSVLSLRRMLEVKGKTRLIDKVIASSIPYRP